jgi:hypothetical protein
VSRFARFLLPASRSTRRDLTFVRLFSSPLTLLRTAINPQRRHDYSSLFEPLPLDITFVKPPPSTPTLFLSSSKHEHTPNASTAQPASLKAWEAAVPKELEFRGSMLEGSHELKDGGEGWEELARWETS